MHQKNTVVQRKYFPYNTVFYVDNTLYKTVAILKTEAK